MKAAAIARDHRCDRTRFRAQNVQRARLAGWSARVIAAAAIGAIRV